MQIIKTITAPQNISLHLPLEQYSTKNNKVNISNYSSEELYSDLYNNLLEIIEMLNLDIANYDINTLISQNSLASKNSTDLFLNMANNTLLENYFSTIEKFDSFYSILKKDEFSKKSLKDYSIFNNKTDQSFYNYLKDYSIFNNKTDQSFYNPLKDYSISNNKIDQSFYNYLKDYSISNNKTDQSFYNYLKDYSIFNNKIDQSFYNPLKDYSISNNKTDQIFYNYLKDYYISNNKIDQSFNNSNIDTYVAEKIILDNYIFKKEANFYDNINEYDYFSIDLLDSILYNSVNNYNANKVSNNYKTNQTKNNYAKYFNHANRPTFLENNTSKFSDTYKNTDLDIYENFSTTDNIFKSLFNSSNYINLVNYNCNKLLEENNESFYNNKTLEQQLKQSMTETENNFILQDLISLSNSVDYSISSIDDLKSTVNRLNIQIGYFQESSRNSKDDVLIKKVVDELARGLHEAIECSAEGVYID